ncbi:T-cell acute lymphocytic leukemia protein 2 isoform X4 [Neoarius graeffei]|uniref:T-cell acute lymphocytic leukemia protein 2 isoform X4 n=1 Tax=Neoarius graeffei TaxID=443677 RepID=UPI00298C4CF7|nr:T-cell acute lymphocytic leukemia protein 2 isoform X4 [Neoarius graeffei]
MDHICGFFYFYKNSVFITFYFTFHHQEKQRSICTGVPLSVPGETERKTGETDRQTDREEEPVLIRESSSLTPGPQRNEPGQNLRSQPHRLNSSLQTFPQPTASFFTAVP